MNVLHTRIRSPGGKESRLERYRMRKTDRSLQWVFVCFLIYSLFIWEKGIKECFHCSALQFFNFETLFHYKEFFLVIH